MKFSMECIKIKAWDDESFGTDLVDWKRKQSGERDDFFFWWQSLQDRKLVGKWQAGFVSQRLDVKTYIRITQYAS